MLTVTPKFQAYAHSKSQSFGARNISDLKTLSSTLEKEAETLNSIADKIEIDFEKRCADSTKEEINIAGREYVNNLIRNIKRRAKSIIQQAESFKNN